MAIHLYIGISEHFAIGCFSDGSIATKFLIIKNDILDIGVLRFLEVCLKFGKICVFF